MRSLFKRKGPMQNPNNLIFDERKIEIMYENIPEIMTLRECQQLLKVGKNTMLDLIHSGELSAFRIGNRWKITKESVLEFIRYR